MLCVYIYIYDALEVFIHFLVRCVSFAAER